MPMRILALSLLLFGSAGCMAHARPASSKPTEATVEERGENVMQRARHRDAVIISTRMEDHPRFNPALGTLLVVEPSRASLPGIW